MPVIQKTVSVNGTEYNFVNALYKAFKEIDGVTITPDNCDSLFYVTDLSGATVVASDVAYIFTVEYKGIKIKFQRSDILSKSTGSFKVSLPDSDGNISNKTLAYSGSAAYTGKTTRTVKFTFIISDSAVEIILANYEKDYFDSNNIYMLFIPVELNGVNTYLYMNDTKQIAKLSSKTFHQFNGNIPYTIAQNFAFTVPKNGIKMTEGSSLLNSSSYLVMDITGLNNCTIVPANTILTINEDDYFSIGTDVIVKI